jgi:hypothetical protein
MFENFDYIERSLIYQGLLQLVRSNSGEGFLNGDQGHPAYRLGREGKFDFSTLGDSPDQNRLFKLMHELSVALNEAEEKRPSITEYMFSWSDFCRAATDACDQHSRTLC